MDYDDKLFYVDVSKMVYKQGNTQTFLMWDFPSVYCEYHWLIKKLLWAYCSAEQGKTGIPSHREGESRQSQGEAM